MGENEANRFYFALTLGKVKISEKWYKMVEVNGA